MFRDPRVYLHVSIDLLQNIGVRLHILRDDFQCVAVLFKHFKDAVQELDEEIAHSPDTEYRTQSWPEARKVGQELVYIHIRQPILRWLQNEQQRTILYVYRCRTFFQRRHLESPSPYQ